MPRHRLAQRLGSAVETNPRSIRKSTPAGDWRPEPLRLVRVGHAFLPQYSGEPQRLNPPIRGGFKVYLTVTPERVEHIDPVGIQMSFLRPDAAEVKKVMSALCHFVHFFPSHAAGQSWAERHSGTFLLSIDDA